MFVEAAAGDPVTMAGAKFTELGPPSFRDIQFTATVMLDGSSNFAFHGVTLDGGATEEAALQIHGQSSAGASHDVLVEDSTIKGGGRTIFILGKFAPSDTWNHHLTFVRDDITCGSHNCFQISGGRDIDDRRQPYQRHDDRGRAHGGRDARRDHAQPHEGYGRQTALRDRKSPRRAWSGTTTRASRT